MERKSIHTVVIVALVLGAVGGGYLGLTWWKEQKAWPDGLIQANGRIEGDVISVATKFTGRVDRLFVREGDTVTSGQNMVQLDDVQTRAKVEQAQQAWEVLEDRVEATHTDLSILNLSVPLVIEAADAKIREAEATIKKSLAVTREAEEDFLRYRRLLEHDNVTLREYQEAQRKQDVASNEVVASRAALDKAKKDLAHSANVHVAE